MERGQRRTSPQRQPQRRPAQPTRPVNRKRKKNKSKKPWIIAAVILLAIIVFGSGGNDNTPTVRSDALETVGEPTFTVSAGPTEEPSPEPQTSAMVDHIVRTAKADASGSDAETKAIAAFDWIVSTVPQWYDGPEIMEQAIYNGALVQYYYEGRDDVRAAVGEDVIQSAKYVYRGVETVLDDATQENIRQIKEGIEKARGD